MSATLQTWLALGIVALTVAIFIYRLTRPASSGCGAGCGCAKPVRKK